VNDSQCPNCDSDLTESVRFALIACVNAGANGVADILCPRCGTDLSVHVMFSATVVLPEPALAN